MARGHRPPGAGRRIEGVVDRRLRDAERRLSAAELRARTAELRAAAAEADHIDTLTRSTAKLNAIAERLDKLDRQRRPERASNLPAAVALALRLTPRQTRQLINWINQAQEGR